MWKVRSRTATADATSSTTKITRPYRRHLFPAGLAAAVLWLHLACPVRAEVDSRIVEAVGDAARELGDRFSEIRRDVLGADALAVSGPTCAFYVSQCVCSCEKGDCESVMSVNSEFCAWERLHVCKEVTHQYDEAIQTNFDNFPYEHVALYIYTHIPLLLAASTWAQLCSLYRGLGVVLQQLSSSHPELAC